MLERHLIQADDLIIVDTHGNLGGVLELLPNRH